MLKFPEPVVSLIRTLNRAGYEAYAVGGCVRDALLGLTPNDWDLTTSATPEQIEACFRTSRVIETGMKHGTVTVMKSGVPYEITTYRKDGAYTDHRRPDTVAFVNDLSEDLKRRDFTINAMAYSDRTGIIDIFGGMEDIDRRLVRAVGDPAERFDEDALRILRAVRFAAKLGYDIEEHTFNEAARLAPTLAKISAERIREELQKIIMSDHPERLRDAYRMGITAQVLKEWDIMMECEQNTPHHFLSVGEHTIYALEDCVRSDADLSEDDRKLLRLAILLHDSGKPSMKTTDEDGIDHFKMHPDKSEEIAIDVLRRLKYDNDTIAKVRKLVKYHDYRPKLTLCRVRHLIVNVGAELMPLLMMVKEIDLRAHSNYQMDEKRAELDGLEELYDTIMLSGDCLSLKDMKVSGRDLIEAGIPKGVMMGEILNELFDMVLEDPDKNDRVILLSSATEIYTAKLSGNPSP